MKPTPIYSSQAIRDWESRWFAKGNSSYGLMAQASLAMAHQVIKWLHQKSINTAQIIVWCGVGNNGGDGYLLAKYLNDLLDNCPTVQIFAPYPPKSPDALRARQDTAPLPITEKWSDITQNCPHVLHIDALFGHGLNQPLSDDHQALICLFNEQHGRKIAIDLPSGLHPDTGMPQPICTDVEMTLCVMGLKMGLYSGMAKAYVGEVVNLPLIPNDDLLTPCAHLSAVPRLPSRHLTAHKGDFGSVAIIGGHPTMGGAVMLASASAMSVGAGKVTALCHATHHSPLLAYRPNVMVADLDTTELSFLLSVMDSVCFGVGLGRDDWAEHHYHTVMNALNGFMGKVVLDADALYFLAKYPQTLPDNWIATPHAGEAGRLLGIPSHQIDADRLHAVMSLQSHYGGTWVLKGANSLTFDGKIAWVCPFGNPSMATAGMGDVLAGMMAGLIKAQTQDVVSLHALAGDALAKTTTLGLNAHDMTKVIGQTL